MLDAARDTVNGDGGWHLHTKMTENTKFQQNGMNKYKNVHACKHNLTNYSDEKILTEPFISVRHSISV